MSEFIEHTPKLWEHPAGKFSLWMFYCPGCKESHAYHVGDLSEHYGSNPGWQFNGNIASPTFTPSLLCNGHDPAKRCHLFLTDGVIQFLDDCHHELRGQKIPMEEI